MNTQISGGMSWFIEGYLDRMLGGRAVGWAFMMRNATDEIVTVNRGWARAPWETSMPAVPVGPSTRMMIASMSKLVTNITLRAMIDDWNWILTQPNPWPFATPLRPGMTPAMVQRAQQSRQALTLDTHVLQLIGHLVPSPGAGTQAISLRHLLTHSSGIDLDSVDWHDGGDVDTVDLWGGIARTFALGVAAGHTPGDGFPGYRNQHYTILRGVIEDVTGTDYENYCRLRTWAAAGTGIPSCHNSDTPPTLYYPRQAPLPGLDRNGQPSPGANWPDYARRAGAFGWYVTVRDITRLLVTTRAGSVLTAASTNEFLTLHDGLMTFNVGGSSGVGHNGGWGTDGGSFGGCAATFDNGLSAALFISNDPGIDATELFSNTVSMCVPRLLADAPRWVAPRIDVRNPFGFGDLRMTTDGTMPTAASPMAGAPVLVTAVSTPTAVSSTTVTAMLFDGTTAVSLPARSAVFNGPQLRPSLPAPTTPQGLAWSARAIPSTGVDRVPGFHNLPSSITATGTGIPNAALGGMTTNYALEFRGYVMAPNDGVYTFELTSDDGSQLWIGDNMIIDNDGGHASVTVTGAAGLKAGAHPIVVTFYQGGGGAALSLMWSGPALAKRAVALADFHGPDTLLLPAMNATAGKPGVSWRLAPTYGNRVPTFDSSNPTPMQGQATSISLDSVQSDVHYALEWKGLIKVPADGTYTFHLNSDDGSRLWIGPLLVVDNDGGHGATNVDGQIGLKAGLHRLRLLFYQGGGGQALTLTWTRPGQPAAEALDSVLFIEA